MELSSIREYMNQAAQRPGLHGVTLEFASKAANSITSPAELVWKFKAFKSVEDGSLIISPFDYIWQVKCGELRSTISSVIDWETQDLLWKAIVDGAVQLRDKGSYWDRNFRHLHQFSCNLLFADIGFLAIKTNRGLWWQIYRNGWPLSPPLLEQTVSQNIGFVVGASLNNPFFSSKPFTEDTISHWLPTDVANSVKVEWLPEGNPLFHQYSDLLPMKLPFA